MIGNDWDNLLKDEYNKDYFKDLEKFVLKEYNAKYLGRTCRGRRKKADVCYCLITGRKIP